VGEEAGECFVRKKRQDELEAKGRRVLCSSKIEETYQIAHF
jgi:hypothetical protein